MKVLFLITARGGSKGVKRKNVREIAGLPLVAYKIITAQKCGFDGRIIVSTDDDEIAEVSKKYGAESPFKRPDYLSSDKANSVDVVAHALEWTEKNDANKYDCICLLEPSSPFAYPEDLNNALNIYKDSGADVVLGVKKADVSRRFIWPLDDQGRLSNFYNSVKEMGSVLRQDQKDEYTLNGCMYIVSTDYFKHNRILHAVNSRPYIMPVERSIEIDTEYELKYGEFCVEQGLIDINRWII